MTCKFGTQIVQVVSFIFLVFATCAHSQTTTDATVTAPSSCSTDGELYPSSTCNVYYECVLALWNYYVVEVTCPSGQAYNSTSEACEDSSTCGASTTTESATTTTTESATTTTTASTTTAAVTAPTSCSSSGALYASSTCNVYYKCVKVLWNYYVVEMTCSSGQAYNSTSQECEDSSTCTS